MNDEELTGRDEKESLENHIEEFWQKERGPRRVVAVVVGWIAASKTGIFRRVRGHA